MTRPVPRPYSAARRASTRVLGGIGVLVLAVIFLVPIVVLLLSAFRSGSPFRPGPWTIDGFITVMTDPATWVVVVNSVVLGVVTTFFALLIGTFLAWVSVKTLSPLRRWITPTFVVILLVPSLFYGLGWIFLTTGTRSPLGVLIHLLGIEGSPTNTGWIPLLLIVTGFVIPISYLFMLGPVRKLDGATEDAARIAGASRRTVFWTITVPLLRPSLLGVFALMLSYSFSAFELPLLFGSPDGIFVFSTAVLNAINGSVSTEAASLSLLLLVFVTIVVLARAWFTSRRRFSTISGKGYRAEPRDYGRVQWVFTAVFLVVLLGAGVLPVGQMIVGSFQPTFGGGIGVTLDHYIRVLAEPKTVQALSNTIVISLVAGFLATAIAVPLAYLAHKRGGWVRMFAGLITWAPATIPGVIVGLALITAYLPIPGLRSLFGTIWLMIIGFVVISMPVTARAVEGNISQISAELEEASRVSGASAFTTFVRVILPLVAPSFFAAWFLAGLGISGNLSLPALLATPSLQTVASRAYDLYGQGMTAQAAALFITLILTLLIAAAVLWLLGNGLRLVLGRVDTARRARTLSVPTAPLKGITT